jgi:hypothetical protein
MAANHIFILCRVQLAAYFLQVILIGDLQTPVCELWFALYQL